MVLVTALLKWWQPGYILVSWTVLGVAAGLAVLAEVLECVLGTAGSHQVGTSHELRSWPWSAASWVGSWARRFRC
jgi:hypothetical protein